MQKPRRRRSDRAGRPAMRSPGRPPVAGREEQRRFWKVIARGLSSEDAAVLCGVSPPVGGRWFRGGGGMPPISVAPRSARYLSFAEREDIAVLRAQGAGVRDIARRLRRAASTVSRELRRNAATRSGGLEYRASTAQWHRDRRATALVRGCGQAYALQTVEPVTSRCGTRRVCQARSSGSERYTRARPHAVAPMNCVPEDSRRRSTCTGRTHAPRARADGNQTPSSTVAVRAPSPS